MVALEVMQMKSVVECANLTEVFAGVDAEPEKTRVRGALETRGILNEY